MSSTAKISPPSSLIEKIKQGFQPIEMGVECSEFDEEDTGPLKYMMTDLTPAMLEEARSALKETEESRVKGLEELRQLIKQDCKLSSPTDDGFLLAFLRARKFNVKRAFKLLQNFWKFRKDHKSIFDTSDDRTVKELILRNFLGILPFRDKNGCVVMIFKIGQWNPELDVYEEIFRAVSAVLIHSIQFPASQICGYRIILDLRGITWKQLKMCTPANLLIMIHSTQYCFPARYKRFHILWENKLFKVCWNIAYPLLTSKVKKRVVLHGKDTTPLSEFIDSSVLPVEYGGNAGPFENSIYVEVMERSTAAVLNLLNYGYTD